MNRTVVGIIAILVMAVIGWGGYSWYTVSMNWAVESQATSPGDHLVATHMIWLGKDDQRAKMADHVVLSSAYWPLGHFWGETLVFVGYCAPFSMGWVAPRQLTIHCTRRVNTEIIYREADLDRVDVSFDIK